MLPVPKWQKGCFGLASHLRSWSQRQWSLCWFLECSESTAWSSRSVADSVKSGCRKNWANLSSAPLKWSGLTPK